MAIVKPFRAFRPRRDIAARMASPPYDVISTEEARALAQGNPASFLRVTRAEIELPTGADPYAETVYRRGAETLHRFIDEGLLTQDKQEGYYLYAQKMGNHEQRGIAALFSVDEYDADKIKKHEKTRADKEDDRTRHTLIVGGQPEPVFLACRPHPALREALEGLGAGAPEYQFTARDTTGHALWAVNDPARVQALEAAFEKVPALYVADGHHRCAAAARTRAQMKAKNSRHTGSEPYNFFMGVVFPADELQILPYNRLIADLNGLTPGEFLVKLSRDFHVEKNGKKAPVHRGEFCMFLSGAWHTLIPKSAAPGRGVEGLDVSVLQNTVLSPLLGIGDPRTSKRIDFAGGIRGAGYLESRVQTGDFAAAFSLYPTPVEELLDIADGGGIMPPKSTWFEPKLKSGLFVHLF